jgi:hypothetical protein
MCSSGKLFHQGNNTKNTDGNILCSQRKSGEENVRQGCGIKRPDCGGGQAFLTLAGQKIEGEKPERRRAHSSQALVVKRRHERWEMKAPRDLERAFPRQKRRQHM